MHARLQPYLHPLRVGAGAQRNHRPAGGQGCCTHQPAAPGQHLVLRCAAAHLHSPRALPTHPPTVHARLDNIPRCCLACHACQLQIGDKVEMQASVQELGFAETAYGYNVSQVFNAFSGPTGGPGV